MNKTTCTAADLAAANLLTPAREVMIAHGIVFSISADGEVTYTGDETDEMWDAVEAADRAEEAATVRPSLGSWYGAAGSWSA